MTESKYNEQENDHDLLIRIDEKLRMFMLEVGNIKKEVGNKIDKSELQQHIETSCAKDQDHENRIRRLEKWGFTAIGSLAIIQLIISVVK